MDDNTKKVSDINMQKVSGGFNAVPVDPDAVPPGFFLCCECGHIFPRPDYESMCLDCFNAYERTH